jgi:GntR family transcriptional regulator, N-acetylglucosamine utilization regulator
VAVMQEGLSMSGQTPIHAASKASLLPLYYQVERDMRRQIESGIWQAGQQIPSEKELCALYDVSRITIRQAISALVDEGLISRERGRGSFVRSPVITAGARGLTSFSDEMAVLGMRPGARVLSIRREPASPEMAERLHIEAGDPIVVIHRLRYADETPIGIQTAYLPSARFPGLEHANLTEQSLYKHLEEQYGVQPAEAHETFSVTAVTGEDAHLLSVPDGACGFHVERLTYDQKRELFECVTSTMRGDRYQVQLVVRASRRE